jgi:hypothetical protein
MTLFVRPIRAIYLFASLAVGLIIAHYNHPYAAVITTFLLVQFDVTLRGA